LHQSALVPRGLLDPAQRGLDQVARIIVRAGITANAVTVASLGFAVGAGILLSVGNFVWAAVAMVIACLGDALDGLVARRSASASVGGALLDASVDRYEEFFFIGGLALYLRASAFMLAVALFALAGSFMVSYGSAKAESLRVSVPPGLMRRTERAVCLCSGVGLVPVFAWLARESILPSWAARAPLFAALTVIAVGANTSAIRRLRALARVPSP